MHTHLLHTRIAVPPLILINFTENDVAGPNTDFYTRSARTTRLTRVTLAQFDKPHFLHTLGCCTSTRSSADMQQVRYIVYTVVFFSSIESTDRCR